MTSSDAPSSIQVVSSEDDTAAQPVPRPSSQDKKKGQSRFTAFKNRASAAKESVEDNMEHAATLKSVGDEVAQGARLGQVVVDNGMTKTSSVVSDAIDDQVDRKIFGVGEDGLNKAKVFFITLTGILSLCEASIIMATCESTVLVDYPTLRDSVIMPILESFTEIERDGASVRGERRVNELAADFNASDWYPECLGGPGLNRTGFRTADPLASPPPPYWTTPQGPPPPPYWTAPQSPPPPFPPPSSEIVGGILTEYALTNLWFADSDHTGCKNDKLFQVSATAADCHPEDVECVDYMVDGVEDAGKHIKNMVYVYVYSMFLAAFAWTGARLALHYLTLRDSSLCNCCAPKCKKFWLLFLKKGGPVSLNSLMILNTNLAWDEEVYAYGLGLGQWDIIFAMSNVLLMTVAIVTMLILFCLPVCCACCASRATRGSRARRASQEDGTKKKVRGPLDAVGTCGKWYLTLTLYVLSFEGLLITVLSAFIHFFQTNYSANGLALPETPQQIFESFPLVQMVMTWFMVPDDIDIALGSSILEVQVVAVMRCAKVGAVALPFLIDLALLVMACKYDGPPLSCCKACAPGWCGPHKTVVVGKASSVAMAGADQTGTPVSPAANNQQKKQAGAPAPASAVQKAQELGAAAGEVARQEVEHGAEYAVAASQQKLESLQTDVQQRRSSAMPTDSREAIDDAQAQAAAKLEAKEEEGEELDLAITALQAALAVKPGGARLEKLRKAVEGAHEAGVGGDPKHAALLKEGEAALEEEEAAARSFKAVETGVEKV